MRLVALPSCDVPMRLGTADRTGPGPSYCSNLCPNPLVIRSVTWAGRIRGEFSFMSAGWPTVCAGLSCPHLHVPFRPSRWLGRPAGLLPTTRERRCSHVLPPLLSGLAVCCWPPGCRGHHPPAPAPRPRVAAGVLTAVLGCRSVPAFSPARAAFTLHVSLPSHPLCLLWPPDWDRCLCVSPSWATAAGWPAMACRRCT